MRTLIIIATICVALITAYFMIPPITIGERAQSGYDGKSALTDEDISRSIREAEEAVKRAEDAVKKLDEIKARQNSIAN